MKEDIKYLSISELNRIIKMKFDAFYLISSIKNAISFIFLLNDDKK